MLGKRKREENEGIQTGVKKRRIDFKNEISIITPSTSEGKDFEYFSLIEKLDHVMKKRKRLKENVKISTNLLEEEGDILWDIGERSGYVRMENSIFARITLTFMITLLIMKTILLIMMMKRKRQEHIQSRGLIIEPPRTNLFV